MSVGESKRCSKCGSVLALSAFHKDSRRRDGLRSSCSACVAAYQTGYRSTHAAKIRLSDRRRAQRPDRVERERVRLKLREKSPERKAWYARWVASRPWMKRAHHAVRDALLRGEIKRQPCCVCGRTDQVAAHHDDYSAPLGIQWLCPAHHRARHAALRAAGDEPGAAAVEAALKGEKP